MYWTLTENAAQRPFHVGVDTRITATKERFWGEICSGLIEGRIPTFLWCIRWKQGLRDGMKMGRQRSSKLATAIQYIFFLQELTEKDSEFYWLQVLVIYRHPSVVTERKQINFSKFPGLERDTASSVFLLFIYFWIGCQIFRFRNANTSRYKYAFKMFG